MKNTISFLLIIMKGGAGRGTKNLTMFGILMDGQKEYTWSLMHLLVAKPAKTTVTH